MDSLEERLVTLLREREELHQDWQRAKQRSESVMTGPVGDEFRQYLREVRDLGDKIIELDEQIEGTERELEFRRRLR